MGRGVRHRGAGRRDTRQFGLGTRTTETGVAFAQIYDGAIDVVFDVLDASTIIDSGFEGIATTSKNKVYNIMNNAMS